MDHKSIALRAWRRCIDLFGRGYPADEDEVFPLLEEARNAAERHQLEHPDDPELRGLLLHWQDTLEGLEIPRDRAALVHCLAGSSALGKAQDSVRVLRGMVVSRMTVSRKREARKRILALVEEQAIPAFEHALRLKSDYNAAHSGLRHAQELSKLLEGESGRRRWWVPWR